MSKIKNDISKIIFALSPHFFCLKIRRTRLQIGVAQKINIPRARFNTSGAPLFREGDLTS